MPKLSEERQQERREQIVDAALRCFARQGMAGTSMADIIAESGLSAGSIYSHFSGRAELIRFASATRLGTALDQLDAARQAMTDVVTPEDCVTMYLSHVQIATGQARMLVQIWAECLRDDELGELVQGNLARIGAWVRDCLRPWAEQQARGRCVEEIVDVHAEIVVARILGTVTLRALSPERLDS